ncbi:MAG: four helix bundle protein [Candidatus Zixiibacteriota bacterium]|nr:MAG: four helix bundle protein [candidate division Zixibacteria bacterium]
MQADLHGRPAAKSFEDLILWKKAHRFVLDIYALSETFPRREIFGMTSQFRRAAVSIPANIAEGFRKQGASDKARFLNIAEGSLEECRYYLILTQDLKYGETHQLKCNLEEISKLLDAYRKSILANFEGRV